MDAVGSSLRALSSEFAPGKYGLCNQHAHNVYSKASNENN